MTSVGCQPVSATTDMVYDSQKSGGEMTLSSLYWLVAGVTGLTIFCCRWRGVGWDGRILLTLIGGALWPFTLALVISERFEK